ncbi:MAG: adenylate/guanylate cyclase domain-containing protein [Deltaproteobacteria bacterium]|nr:adenylate/guanylate cyclase domain-containing protein [Deltaproteobacteria bacterium]
MSENEKLKSLIKESETYRKQGLLKESKEIYEKALVLIQKNKDFSKNTELVDAVKDKVEDLESELIEIEALPEIPDLPPELQDLITKLFAFSKDKDMAAIEGAVALAKFGQYEKALEEFQKLISGGSRGDIQKEMVEMSHHFNAIVKELSESYKSIREQSVQLFKDARELSDSYQKIREEEELRDRLSRYVGSNLVERLMKAKDGVLFENERKEVTILFADIRSFTMLSERMPAEEVVSMLNEFFSAMVDIIFKNSGILDKFVGDQLMAVFGLVPTKKSTPYDNAIRAAVDMQHATEELMKVRNQRGLEPFEIGIGIHTGTAIVGNVGSRNRMDYTVIGDCVNVAARFQQLAKGGEIIIGDETYSKSLATFRTKKRGEIKLKNKAEPVICHEILR